MSTFKVPLTTIKAIKPHGNADSLELAQVYDYDVIVPKNIFEVGNTVIYVPVGSVLGPEIEEILFPEGSKITLHNSRVRAIKIRGVVSQGMLVNPFEARIREKIIDLAPLGHYLDHDVAEYLGITKYVEPVQSLPQHMQTNPNANPYKVREFKEYTDIEHGKYYDRVLQDGEMVVITQKLHGTSARYGYFPRPTVSLLDKARKWLGLLPEWHFCWGSRRAQIQAKPGQSHPGFSSEAQGVNFGDVYTKIAVQENLRFKLPKGYSVYGEIVGWGIQKGFLYNCGKDEHNFYVYDVMKDGKYLDYKEAVMFCDSYGLNIVPLLYIGPYSKAEVDSKLTVNNISKETAEGVVVKPLLERSAPSVGRVIFKHINPEYLLLKNNTEFQ